MKYQSLPFSKRRHQSARQVFAKHFGQGFEMPSTKALPSFGWTPEIPKLRDRRGDIRWCLDCLAIAYALYVEIEASERRKEYYRELRRHHGQLRKDTDVLTLIIRSVRPLPSKTARDKSNARTLLGTWSTAIRNCLSVDILPHHVGMRGMKKREGIAQWAKRELSRRNRNR